MRLTLCRHPPQLRRKKSAEKYKEPPGRFDMSSTYKDDYLKHPYAREGPLKVGTKDGPENGAFAGSACDLKRRQGTRSTTRTTSHMT